MAKVDDTPGERLFAAYLYQYRLTSDREPLIGGRRPDFLVHHPVLPFAAEVYEPELRFPAGGRFIDSYRALRRMFKARKSDQVKAMKEAGLPCIVILARTNSDIRFQPEIVAGAMFGDVGVLLPLDDPDAEGRTVFGSGGRVQRERNRGVSAVAILEDFNPTLYRAEEAVAARLGKGIPWRPGLNAGTVVREQAAVIRSTNEVYEHMTATRAFIPEARVVKLTVLHNPYAAHPIGLDVLDSPHDVQWGPTTTTTGEPAYGPVKWGPLVIRPPRLSEQTGG